MSIATKKSERKKRFARASKSQVAIIMGSKTDWKVMQGAQEALQMFGVTAHIEVVSAHRTPEAMVEFASGARARGFSVLIAGAGGAAHLPGMVASLTTLPVIGVPVAVNSLKGLDSLLSIVQMPKGVPVATVAIDNAYNAGLLAARLLGVFDPKLASRLEVYRKGLKVKVKVMNRDLRKLATKV